MLDVIIVIIVMRTRVPIPDDKSFSKYGTNHLREGWFLLSDFVSLSFQSGDQVRAASNSALTKRDSKLLSLLLPVNSIIQPGAKPYVDFNWLPVRVEKSCLLWMFIRVFVL